MDLDIEGLDNLEFVGRGRHGAVYRAFQSDLDRTVAVKLVELDDEEGRRRFTTEQTAAGRLSDLEGVVTVFSTGIAGDGRGFLISEWMPGGSLKDEGGRRGWEEAAAIGLSIIRTLASAHERGVVHGDLKPANVLTDSRGALRLGDFGLSRLSGAPGHSPGTPGYAAPELAAGSPATAAADVYAWAALMVALLTGSPPSATGTYPPIRGPDRFADLIQLGLSHEPARRPPASELAAALDDLLGVETVPVLASGPVGRVSRRRRVAWAGGLAAAAGVAAVALLASAPGRPPGTTVQTTAAVVSPTTTAAPTTLPVATQTTSEGPSPFQVTVTNSNGYEVRSIDLGGGQPWSPAIGEDRLYVASEDRLLAFSLDDGSILLNRTLSGPSTAPPLLFDGVVYVPVMQADCEEKCAALHTFDVATGRLAMYAFNRIGVPYTPEVVPNSPWCRSADIFTNYNRGPPMTPDPSCLEDGSQEPILKIRLGRTEFLVPASRDLYLLRGNSPRAALDGPINPNPVRVTRQNLVHCVPWSSLTSPAARLDIPTSCLRDDTADIPNSRLVVRDDLQGELQVGSMRLEEVPPPVSDRAFQLRLAGRVFIDWFNDSYGEVAIIGLARDVGPVDALSRRFAVAPDGSVWVLTNARVAHRFDLSNLQAPTEVAVQVGPCPTGADRGFTECTHADPGGAMAIDGAIIYVPNGGDDSVHRLNTTTFEVDGWASVGGDPGTPVVWGGGVWVADVEHARLVEVGADASGTESVQLTCGSSVCPGWTLAQEWDRRPVVAPSGLWIPWQGVLIRVSAQS